MTQRPESDLDEARLQSLFDRTADVATGPTLTKLSARAADIPARTRRRPWWMSLRLALPASAALAGVLAVLMLPDASGEVTPPPAPIAAAKPVPSVVEPRVPLQAPSVDPDSEPETELDALAFDDPAGSALDFGIDDAESDAELESWLLATADLVDEGG